MSEHKAHICWQRESPDFSYENYNRNHEWRFDNGVIVQASAAPDFHGARDRVDPEESFVAAVAACHMLTFLALCARRRLVVDQYQDEACGWLQKNAAGKLAITKITLQPQITFQGTPPSAEQIRNLHHRSHEECFIANSILTEVEVVQEPSCGIPI